MSICKQTGLKGSHGSSAKKSDVEISVLKVNKGLIRWDVCTGLYIAPDFANTSLLL